MPDCVRAAAVKRPRPTAAVRRYSVPAQKDPTSPYRNHSPLAKERKTSAPSPRRTRSNTSVLRQNSVFHRCGARHIIPVGRRWPIAFAHRCASVLPHQNGGHFRTGQSSIGFSLPPLPFKTPSLTALPQCLRRPVRTDVGEIAETRRQNRCPCIATVSMNTDNFNSTFFITYTCFRCRAAFLETVTLLRPLHDSPRCSIPSNRTAAVFFYFFGSSIRFYPISGREKISFRWPDKPGPTLCRRVCRLFGVQNTSVLQFHFQQLVSLR